MTGRSVPPEAGCGGELYDMRISDIERVCDVAFRRWCAEELIDPRLELVLEEAFIAGFLARDGVRHEPPARARMAP